VALRYSYIISLDTHDFAGGFEKECFQGVGMGQMNIRKRLGFTMIEMLMVILLVAILAVVAIPQFIDFRTEAKDAATRSILGTIRTGIAMQYGQSFLRCGAAAGEWPFADSIDANNATSGATPRCQPADIANTTERQFIAQPVLPDNPWGSNNNVIACNGVDGCTRCNADGCDDATAGGDEGWCYNEATGDFWADSDNSTGGSAECNF
jgi:prepilin-type N-terminal cleavage/methylation domain-containing protein